MISLNQLAFKLHRSTSSIQGRRNKLKIHGTKTKLGRYYLVMLNEEEEKRITDSYTSEPQVRKDYPRPEEYDYTYSSFWRTMVRCIPCSRLHGRTIHFFSNGKYTICLKCRTRGKI